MIRCDTGPLLAAANADAEAAFPHSLIVAERLGITTVATLDPRHFRQVTPNHCVALELVPGEHQLARHRPPRRD